MLNPQYSFISARLAEFLARLPLPQFDRETMPAAMRRAVEDEQQTLLETVFATARHFLGQLPSWFAGVTDPRQAAKVTYSLPCLLFTGVLMFLCRLQARRQIGWLLRNGPATANYRLLFGKAQVPHGDTLNDAFVNLKPEQMQEVVCGLAERLLRSKAWYAYRLFDRYWVVAIDGTGMLTFSTRHCAQCLTRTHHGITTYYHPVLEAKLVTWNGFACSLMTEFIENPGENPTKQDCELKALYRLVHRLKQRFPRLPLLLTLDGLYAGGPTFTLIQQCHWAFMITLKDDDLASVNREFAILADLQPQDSLTYLTGKQGEVKQEFKWVNRIPYTDTERHNHSLAVLQCRESKPGPNSQSITTKFKWITNLKITHDNALPLAQGAGRIRWKVENEGFNVQKNGGYGLEHAYTMDFTAAKIWYFLLQIAHLIAQLVEKGSLFRQQFPQGLGSAKNLAFRLLEAWRNTVLSSAGWLFIQEARLQIRFDTS